MGFIEKLQSKLELYRLEQRYTRRKNRSTFYGDAQYVDGEYVYTNGLTSPAVSKNSTGGHWRPTWGRSTSSDSR
ncbi:hypothetical protein TSTA_114520 [Talaromyces stipitatus ATCC 10500]|uniref:Uncharacterized protein n=1 Tax=Talaromyces stipitatus (strain ATCC 10500 / CBS 375.48 / QM 6759 / NRRL 1006) TaxID=441959 RepID=B8MDB6_TALSN|nr:uncharacterized protein TSTA_114520 [Talaromyces stipitatus ATCC 10500]XP_002481634.1 uncharacterized protein TSTA_114520 [Talaromyces stipitatus ATCC 10500]EED17641.1 hypothetical protein TSTA_114520 [Talaromyces stipitatus ATCC 10500]EED17642.1 hypothetical protein TSTA_114520 [Talaromyces stipitatus ATCC 10500]